MTQKLILFGWLLFLPQIVFAFRLTPMVLHFAPAGNKATQVITLENPTDAKVPIQIEAFTRGVDAKGEESRIKTDEFIIYPEQLVLLPNEKRNIRVTWNGKLADANEKAFRIVASQLPVEFQEKNATTSATGVNLSFLLQYVASAYVTPPGAAPKIRVKEVKKLGGKRVAVTVANEGSAHRVLHVKNLKISAGEKLIGRVSDFKDMQNYNLLAGTEKTFTVVLAKETKEASLRADLELSEVGD